MQNDQCKMQNRELHASFFILHFSFCILHFLSLCLILPTSRAILPATAWRVRSRPGRSARGWRRLLAGVLEDFHSRVQEGAPRAEAVARLPDVVVLLAPRIVPAGREGGFLEEAL